MVAEPVLPRNAKSPLAETRRTQRAEKRIREALKETQRFTLQLWSEVPVNEYTVNRRRYEYLIDVSRLADIIRQIKAKLRETLGTAVTDESVQGYEVGTANAVTNLQGLTQDYQRNISSVLASSPYQTRVAFVRARVFEQMQGFEDQTGADLNRVLSQAVEDGQNPLQTARTIRDRFDVAQSRAERIARTEITGAQRRAVWDENQDAEERLGIRTRLMHLSALLPTSRSWHIARHGDIFTTDEVREWYSVASNSIQCRCSQVGVLVDENGNLLNDRAQQKALQTKERLGYGGIDS